MKNKLSSFISLVFLLAIAVLARAESRPRVAVVLSGGGAKGVAHIGVLKVIERAGIPVDIITGTSMGSIIGGLYSCGWTAERLDSMVRRQDWAFLLSDKDDYYSQDLHNREKQATYVFSKTFSMSRKYRLQEAGLVQGKNLMKLFRQLTAGYTDSIDFNSLPIPFACVATNIVDNTEYDFHSGVLAEAMRTSMSIPAFFSPVRKGDMVLVDGGLRNNYPADIAKEMGADYIIGATVQGASPTADELSSGMSVLGQIVNVNCKNKYDANLALTDVAIRVNTKGYSAASFTPAAIDTLVRRGEEEAMRHWDDLMALKRRLGLDDGYKPQPLPFNNEALQPTNFTAADTLHRPKHDVAQGSVGLRFDTEDMVAMQLNGVYSMSKRPVDLEATLRLGKNIHAMMQGTWFTRRYVGVSLAYNFWHNDIDMYQGGHDDYNFTLNHHQVKFAVAGLNLRNLSMDLSARFDSYNFHKLMISSKVGHESFKLSSDNLVSYHANLHYNSENTAIFPTRGAKFMAGYAYFTDNFTGYNGHKGFSEVDAAWRMSFRLNNIFTFQPMLYGRLLFGSDIPRIRRNIVGGEWFGHYLEQQMPFAGIGHTELVDDHFVACQLKLQARLTENNYVLLKAVGTQEADKPRYLLDDGPTLGFQTAYYYKTMFGPVGATLGWSDKTHRVNFFINLGYEF